MADLTSGPLDWETVDAEIVATEDLIHDEACSDTYQSCSAHRQRVADLRFFLHTRLCRLAGGEVADCPTGSSLTFSGSVGYGSLLVDRTEWAPGFVVNGEHHCTGLFAAAPSEVVTEVAAGTFSGAVGLHDWNASCGDGVEFSIRQGGVTLWTSDVILGYRDAVGFTVTVEDGELTLLADELGNRSCDMSVWLDLELE